MKKIFLTSFFTLFIALTLASNTSAQEIPEWFIDIHQDSINKQTK